MLCVLMHSVLEVHIAATQHSKYAVLAGIYLKVGLLLHMEQLSVCTQRGIYYY